MTSDCDAIFIVDQYTRLYDKRTPFGVGLINRGLLP